MKAYRRLVPQALMLLSTPFVFGQVRDPVDREEGMRRANIEKFVPQRFARATSESQVNLLKDLGPLIERLSKFTPENSQISDSGDYRARPLKAFERIIETRLGENAESKSVAQIQMKVWSYDSFKRAEEGFAGQAGLMPIILRAGSPTGRKIGELSYYNAEGNESVYVIYLRRNVVVSIAYSGPIKVPKADTMPRLVTPLEDPDLKNKCETLADRVDESIIRLTNK